MNTGVWHSRFMTTVAMGGLSNTTPSEIEKNAEEEHGLRARTRKRSISSS